MAETDARIGSAAEGGDGAVSSITDMHPVPIDVVRSVRDFVRKARKDAEQYDNVELLDDSQVYSLHRLAAEVYAAGWSAGHYVGSEEARDIR